MLRVREVAALLGVHPKTVYTWKEAGKLPWISINGRVRFDRRAVDQFIEHRKVRFLDQAALSQKVVLDLDKYDILYLKGGRDALSKNSGRWNYGIGSVFLRKTKEGKDRWYIYYRDGNRRQVKEVVQHAQNRGEAVVALRQRVVEIFDKKHHPERIIRHFTLKELADKFLHEYAMKEKKSWTTDEFRLRRILARLGDEQVTQITPEAIRGYRQARLDDGISAITANREVALIKRIFNYGIEKDLLAENPVRKVKMFSERDTARDRTLSPDEEKGLFAELAAYVKPLVFLALHTGLRIGEILGLRWTDLNFEKRTIKVEHTKSKKARFVPINSALLVELEKLQSAKLNAKVVFPINRWIVRRAFEDALQRAKIEDFTFHDLRRTFGTRLLERGVDIVTIKRFYGHSSVVITERYLHPRDFFGEKAVELLVEETGKTGENRDHGVTTENERPVVMPVSRSNVIN